MSDIVERLSRHKTMSQFLTVEQLLMDLNFDRAVAKKEIERLRAEVERLKAAAVPEDSGRVLALYSALLMSRNGISGTHRPDDGGTCLCSQCAFVRAREQAIEKYESALPAAPQPPTASVQACRPEDRAILKTDAGREMVAAAVAAMEKPAARTESKS